MNENANNKAAPRLHQYLDSGLDNVWLEGGWEEIETPYGPGVAIKDLEGLHRCIAQCLISKPELLTGPEFRFLRTELDLSQVSVGMLCGVNDRTIREWENSAEVANPANMIIRHIYDQRFNESAARKFEDMPNMIQKLQAVDKALHETTLRLKEAKLKITNADNRWECRKQHAA